MRHRKPITYANVVSTIALLLALSGGVAFAATQIGTKNIMADAVTTPKIAPDAVTAKRIADAAVRKRQMQFPVYFKASPTGGSAPITNGPDPYPVSNGSWTQSPGEINVIFGAADATLAYDGSGNGACEVYFDIRINGQQVGGGNLRTDSTSPVSLTGSLGAQPDIDPVTDEQNELTMQIGSNGDCTPSSTIDSTRFRVLDFG